MQLNVIVLAAALAGGLAACGEPAGSAVTPTAPPTAPSTLVTTTTVPPLPRVVEVVDDVDYYGACGNEVLVLGDRRFYPLLPDELEDFDAALHPVDAVGDAVAGFAARPRVPAPGPGDDVGTLIVYDDGYARFESDSGNVVWLTRDERTYDWVC